MPDQNTTSALVVQTVTTGTNGIPELLALSDTYTTSLYPADSCHLDGIEALSRGNVLVVGLFDQGTVAGMGALKSLSDEIRYGEIKRLFVIDAYRGRGGGRMIMEALEQEARSQQLRSIRLETGIYQPEAIGLYKSLGYTIRGPYGDYTGDPLSVYMEKLLPV
ncbi:MAG: GNAT family N-acetyltransferase [Gammaproteobacteria bacterium]|nr:GNAT family N-acetyltransferase [Gammaproteobacteria bacterium]